MAISEVIDRAKIRIIQGEIWESPLALYSIPNEKNNININWFRK